jgi:exodeoxyribonuclease V alpha subunit
MNELDQDQKNAIQFSIKNKFAVINGGAGVGKTTIIIHIANELIKQHKKINLCCPTGKAAARLREATRMEVTTIHSLLGYNGEFFTNKNIDGVVIIDESSMIDSSLMAHIINANPEAIILVGDQAQLMPVGHGSPFHDIINYRPDIINSLTKCYRNKEAVFKAAIQVRNGINPEKFDNSGGEVWNIKASGDRDQTITEIKNMVKNGDLDFETDIIICPKNDDVNEINKVILELVNPHNDGEKWKVGDRIICLKNFPEKDTWNGTTGTITGIDTGNKVWVKGDISFCVDGSYCDEMLWNGAILKKCQHAYSLTVHKVQGSSYRNVVFCYWQKDAFMMLNRNLIYTAITRTRKKCIVLGEPKSFYSSIQKVQTRKTVIQELHNLEEISEDVLF